MKAAVLAIEQDKRPTLRHLSAAIEVSLSPLLYYLLKGRKPPAVQANGETIFIRHSSSRLKPTLKEENKVHRFLFAHAQDPRDCS